MRIPATSRLTAAALVTALAAAVLCALPRAGRLAVSTGAAMLDELAPRAGHVDATTDAAVRGFRSAASTAPAAGPGRLPYLGSFSTAELADMDEAMVTAAAALGDAARRSFTGHVIAAEGDDTYIDELLLLDDSTLTRWPSHVRRPLTYWVQPGAGRADFTPEDVRQVHIAFADWQATGIPLRFAPTSDSASANIVVLWTSQFAEPISGKTRWMHDHDGWIRSARVTLALHRYTGEQLTPDALHALALHEVGHALGLDHASDAANVMAPKVRVRALSDADRATVQLLYRLPPGALGR